MKRFMCFILAAILLIGTVPLTVFSAGPGIPKSLYYGGDEYTLISDLYSDSYYKATSYIAVARYGDDYFALGSDLGTVALTYSSAALSATSGVAVLTPEPNPAVGGGNARITDAGKVQIVGAGYLHSAGDGDLSIVQNAVPDGSLSGNNDNSMVITCADAHVGGVDGHELAVLAEI